MLEIDQVDCARYAACVCCVLCHGMETSGVANCVEMGGLLRPPYLWAVDQVLNQPELYRLTTRPGFSSE